MAASSFLQYVRFAYLSKPASDRPLYRAIRSLRPKSIVELGVGIGIRSKRLIQVAQRYAGNDKVRYTGIDLFEGRSANQPGLTLKRAHTTLKSLGAKVQLVPGDPFSALARAANALVGTDLVVIGADQDSDSLKRAWFYVPRMLTDNSRVFLEEYQEDEGARTFQELDLAAIKQIAVKATGSAKRAA